ncbi:MAG: serine acetyltransferase [Bacteroidales bacterium]
MSRDEIIALAANALTPEVGIDHKLPCIAKIEQLLELCRAVVFPKYYCENASLFLIGRKIEKIYDIIVDQIDETTAGEFVLSLNEIKRLIMTDVDAVYNGDPAAKSHTEVIFCYPAITAILFHRIAYSICKSGNVIIPRIISEMAHSLTGIDIHPCAQIGESFSIDHGTGVVIGETTIIGCGVRLYQGVTLGARSFRTDDNGNPINIPRHPIIGDNVVIYSNTSVLGRIKIGEGSVIGGNVWLTESVPPKSKITQSPINYIK